MTVHENKFAGAVNYSGAEVNMGDCISGALNG